MTRTTRKTICGIVLIAFIAAVVVFFAVATSGFTNWDGSTWFDRWGKGAATVTTPNPDKDKPGTPSEENKTETPETPDDPVTPETPETPNEPEQSETETDKENNNNDETAEELTAGTVSSFAVSALNGNNVRAASEVWAKEEYDALPDGCEVAKVGDDLSGKLLVFDFPSFPDNGSIANSGIIQTEKYFFYQEVYSGQGFGCYVGNYEKLKQAATGGMSGQTYTPSNPSCVFFYKSSSYSPNSYSITSWRMPDDMGVIESGTFIANIYVLDDSAPVPDPEPGMYEVLTENPYAGCNDYCGEKLVSGVTYKGGYLVIDLGDASVKSKISAGGSLITSGQNSLYGIDSTLKYKYLITSSNYANVDIGLISDTGKRYFRVDLDSVSWKMETGNTDPTYISNGAMKYIKAHEHKEVLRDDPYTDIDYNAGTEIVTGKTYTNGYLALSVAGLIDYISYHYEDSYSTPAPILTWHNPYNDGLYIKDGDIVYREYQGGNNNVYSMVLEQETGSMDYPYTDGYVYVKADISDITGIDSEIRNIARYITDETVRITVEADNTKYYYDTRKYTAFDLNKIADEDKAWITRAHYTFDGLYTDAACERKYTGRSLEEPTTLYAKFAPNKYTVTFIDFDGNECHSMQVEYNTSANCPTFDSDEYIFNGWYTEDGVKYTDQNITGDLTLYAKRDMSTFTVTFWNGTEKVDEMTIEKGETLSAAIDRAKQNGYRIVSAYTQTDKFVTDIANFKVNEEVEIYVEKIEEKPDENKPDDKPTVKPEQKQSWWDENKWYVLIPSIGALCLILFYVIGMVAKKRGK